MRKEQSTHLPARFLIVVGAAIALGTVLRIFLLCGVIVWSVARGLYICLAALLDLGMLAIDRTITLSQELLQKTALRWIRGFAKNFTKDRGQTDPPMRCRNPGVPLRTDLGYSNDVQVVLLQIGTRSGSSVLPW
jgi:hypothetical protein